MLEILTFTGIDHETNPDEVWELTRKYPQVEFGILVGSRSTIFGDGGRFPGTGVISQWKRFALVFGIDLSVHLCGEYTRNVLRGHLRRVLPMCEGFKRVQVNFNSGVPWDFNRIAEFAEQVSCENVILQRTSQEEPPFVHEKIEHLYDVSAGAGFANFHEWPEPESGIRSGYAGGIGPDNIHAAVDFVEKHSDKRLWLDMETKVRTDKEILDMNKVKYICDEVFERLGDKNE